MLSLSAPQYAKVNDIITANVVVDKLALMKSAVLIIECDPKMVDFIQAVPGTVLNSKQVSLKTDQKQNKSRIVLYIANTGPGISGSGNMLQIALKAKSKGVLNMSFKEAQIISATSGNPENVSLSGAKVEIQ
jgi:hypothetical protein